MDLKLAADLNPTEILFPLGVARRLGKKGWKTLCVRHTCLCPSHYGILGMKLHACTQNRLTPPEQSVIRQTGSWGGFGMACQVCLVSVAALLSPSHGSFYFHISPIEPRSLQNWNIVWESMCLRACSESSRRALPVPCAERRTIIYKQFCISLKKFKQRLGTTAKQEESSTNAEAKNLWIRTGRKW